MKKILALALGAALVPALAGTAHAAGPTWTSGHVTKASTCSTFLSSDCSLWIWTPGFGGSRNVRPHENSPVWNCTSIGIAHGARLGASGVLGKLEADRHKIDGIWTGAKVTVQVGDEDYVRCNY